MGGASYSFCCSFSSWTYGYCKWGKSDEDSIRKFKLNKDAPCSSWPTKLQPIRKVVKKTITFKHLDDKLVEGLKMNEETETATNSDAELNLIQNKLTT